MEQFKKASKASQKQVERDLSQLVSSLEGLEGKVSSGNNGDGQKVVAILESLETRLQTLKRKVSK